MRKSNLANWKSSRYDRPMQLESRTCQCGNIFRVLPASQIKYCSAFCTPDGLGWKNISTEGKKYMVPIPEGYIEMTEFSARCSVPLPTCYLWINQDKIPNIKVGKNRAVKWPEIKDNPLVLRYQVKKGIKGDARLADGSRLSGRNIQYVLMDESTTKAPGGPSPKLSAGDSRTTREEEKTMLETRTDSQKSVERPDWPIEKTTTGGSVKDGIDLMRSREALQTPADQSWRDETPTARPSSGPGIGLIASTDSSESKSTETAVTPSEPSIGRLMNCEEERVASISLIDESLTLLHSQLRRCATRTDTTPIQDRDQIERARLAIKTADSMGKLVRLKIDAIKTFHDVSK